MGIELLSKREALGHWLDTQASHARRARFFSNAPSTWPVNKRMSHLSGASSASSTTPTRSPERGGYYAQRPV